MAPFRLADDVSPTELVQEMSSWAERQHRFELQVEPASLGRFIALRPASEAGDAAMRELATSALHRFAWMQAPLSSQDLDRRLKAPLTDRQRALLMDWHYPYVLDEFRFHMTLTDALDDTHHRQPLIDWWQEEVRRLGPLPIHGVAIFVEPEPSAPFVLWQRFAFAGKASLA